MRPLSSPLLGSIYPEFQVLLRICKNTVRARIPARERIYPARHETMDKVDPGNVYCMHYILLHILYSGPFI